MHVAPRAARAWLSEPPSLGCGDLPGASPARSASLRGSSIRARLPGPVASTRPVLRSPQSAECASIRSTRHCGGAPNGRLQRRTKQRQAADSGSFQMSATGAIGVGLGGPGESSANRGDAARGASGTGIVAGPAALTSLALQRLVRGYQVLLSPIVPESCRFHPTCSEYAIEALTRHGPVRGSWLATRRIARCHPWSPGGHDPVP